jgi:glycerophosphoryl diester phosphodiesterase
VQRRGVSLWAWTVNEEEDIGRVIAAGVNGIISDYPDRLLLGYDSTSERRVAKRRRWKLGRGKWRERLQKRELKIK